MALCENTTFWDWHQAFNASWPLVPVCFQQTVLVYLPTCFLWLATPVQMAYLARYAGYSADTPYTYLSTTKTVLSLVLAAVTLAATCKDVTMATDQSLPGLSSVASRYLRLGTAHFVARSMEIVSFILTAIVVQFERSYCIITSGVLFVYWLLMAATTVVPLYTSIEIQLYSIDAFRFTFVMTYFLLVLTQFFLHCPADGALRGSHAYCSAAACPESTASFLSKLTFFWITKRAHYFTIDKEDSSQVYSCHDDERSQSQECSPLLLRRAGGKETQSDSFPSSNNDSRRQLRRNLTLALIRAFGRQVALSYVLKFISDSLQFVAPFLLKSLIIYIDTRDNRPQWQGYFLSGAMLVTSWLQTLFYHQHYYLAMTSGMRMKSALMAAIYRKSLSLDNSARGRYSVGEVVNLMSVDCQRIQDMMSYTWMVWSIPYQVTLAVYLLWGTLGVPVLAGLFLLLLLVPINGALAYKQQKLQRSNLTWKDRRIRMLSEVLAGIKALKLYAWEDCFLAKILGLRKRELAILRRLAWINAFGIFIWTCAPYLVCLASFSAFVLISPSGVLTADMAFVTLSLFNILQFPIAFIPEMVSCTSQARVSIKRIQEYLCEPDLDRGKGQRWNNTIQAMGGGDVSISMCKATLSWDQGDGFCLSGLNVEIPKGCLVAVVGPVCSGKSSVLAAMLGEMTSQQGTVSVEGSIAYVPQEAWLQNASIKNNILFGAAFNAKKFKRVIEYCALSSDIESFPRGHGTEVGEKGVNLSGGQKQRISLARAVYSESDVFLMDDPLCAVDTQVGKHLFKKVLSNKGCLKTKTRVFTTNAVHWLPLVDLILVMQDGHLVEYGSYGNLVGRDGPLTQYLFSCLKKDLDEYESYQRGDEEILEIMRRMWEHVESATSQSDATTSGDDVRLRHRKSRVSNVVAGPTSSTDTVTTSGETMMADRHGHWKSYTMAELPDLAGEEHVNHGNVSLIVYREYCKNVGIASTVIIVVMFALYQTASVLANVWLSEWTADAVLKSRNATESAVHSHNVTYLTVYGTLGVAQVLFISVYACVASLRMVAASSKMHASMLGRVMNAPMSFFDSTPSGRVLNRFSRDVETLDNNLPQFFFMWVTCVFSVLATLLVVSVETPLFMAVAVPLLVGYWGIQRFFVPTSRQLKRLEATSRSPIFTHFSETLTGSHVIRAFRRQEAFMTTFKNKLDKNLVMYFAGITANRWLGVWIETVSSLVVLATAVFSLVTPGITGAMLGLSVTYALQITQALKWLVRTMSDIETNAVSVERVHEYSLLPQEAPRHREGHLTPGTWPERGDIVITDLSVRYKDHLDPVLMNIHCVITHGEKIAMVGRTGAGKSSLTLALFRILEATQGSIVIDNINIADVGLQDLRSKLTILPQEPIILSGSLRMNLDPYNRISDHDLWKALTLANLKDAALIASDGLDSDVGENGSRMSMGQRQLLCLARALLRDTRILVMDEPTSCVDLDTDSLLQHTVLAAFSHCTVITIAHRVHSILNYDRVMVLQDGQVVEFAPPLQLLKDRNSHFFSLCRSDGYHHTSGHVVS